MIVNDHDDYDEDEGDDSDDETDEIVKRLQLLASRLGRGEVGGEGRGPGWYKRPLS